MYDGINEKRCDRHEYYETYELGYFFLTKNEKTDIIHEHSGEKGN